MTDLRQLAADLDQALAEIDALRDDHDGIMAAVEPILTALRPGSALTTGTLGSAAPRPGAAHVWHALTATEAGDAWPALTSWVDWLTDRYSLDDTIPDCWYTHGALVDELDALRAAWAAAYLDPAARRTEPAYWLDLLNKTLTRVRDWDRYGCAAGTHHDDAPPAPDADRRRDRDEHTFADIAARDDAQRKQEDPT